MPSPTFESAPALFSALGGVDLSLQVSALRAIMADPLGMYRLGPCDGVDLISALIALLARDPDTRERALIALCCYGDARVVEVLVDAIASTPSDPLVIAISNRLSVETLSDAHLAKLRPLLHGAGSMGTRIAAARLLRDRIAPTRGEQLRMALLIPDTEAPPLDDDMLPVWLAEMRGPHGAQARLLLEAYPAEAERLWQAWEQLDEGSREWLIAWTAEARPEIARLALPGVTTPHASRAVLRAALRCALRLGIRVPNAASCLDVDDAEVRASALLLGAADDALEAWAGRSHPSGVRVAAIRRWREVAGADAMPALLARLDDDDWAVRAVAVELLATLGAGVTEHLAPLLTDPRMHVRIAAAQLAVRLEREDLVESHLLFPALEHNISGGGTRP